MFVDRKSSVVGIVHVDDVLLLGQTSLCLKIIEGIKIKIMIRETGRALKIGDTAEFVGKKITLIQNGFEIQGSLKVVESIVKDTNANHCKRVDTPAVKYSAGQLEMAAELDPDSAHHYRSLLGKLMYVAWDRPDIQFGTGAASRGASRPTTVDDQRVKRVARYLSHRKVLQWRFCFHSKSNEKIEVYTDSDWAGDINSRGSTSGGILCYGGCVIKHGQLYRS